MNVPSVRAVASRVLGALLGASFGACVAALFDARSLSRAASSPFVTSFAACLGLVAPVGIGIGIACGVVLCLLLPEGGAAQLMSWARPDSEREKSERWFELTLAPFASMLWLVVVSRWAVAVLASALEPGTSGAVLSLAAFSLGVGLSLSVRLAARELAARWSVGVDPVRSGIVSALLALSALLGAILSGAPSGAGGPLSMLGVLTREELDLRPVGLAFLIALAAVAAPRARSLGLVVAAVVVPLVLCVFTLRASSALDAPGLALGVERSAPLSAPVLRVLRRLNDRDHDGYAAHFGGGDCDDRSAAINPGAEDVPGNGIDEDCSGSDASPLPQPSSQPEHNAGAESARRELLEKLPKALNVVLLTIDTLRYDLGYAGNPRPLSPKLDELAKESVVFDKSYSLASYTAKSLPPLLIGRYSSETHRGFLHFNRFEKSDRFLPERLQQAGIHTVSVQGHWYFFQNYGMERGFDYINSAAAPRAAQAAEGDRSVTSEKLSDEVLAELDKPELRAKPFFLWAHYTDPHAEYVSHPGFEFGSGSRAAYDGEVAFVDHHVGRVLDALRRKPFWSNTVVIVTSDHGEAFVEHAMIRHGFELWEELVRVPLLVRVPNVPPRHVSTRRSAIDLVPTVLDLMHVGRDGELSGVSLLPDLATPVDTEPSPRPVFVDMAEGPNNAERRAFIEGDLKLVLSGGRVLGLYDLAQDPAEKHDVSGEKERSASALEHFRAFRRTLHEVYVRPTR